MDKPGHKALRKGRRTLPNQIYHVTITTHSRNPYFIEIASARVIARSLNDSTVIADSRTLAWCLMPDHLHWLLQLGETASLPTVVQRLKSVTTRRICRSGQEPIWARAFHDHALRSDEDLRSVARYIVANPVRDGLVTHIGDYPHWDAVWVEEDRRQAGSYKQMASS